MIDLILNPKQNLTVGNYDEWYKFKTWVENTKLFHAIITYSGTPTIIEGFDENESLRLAVSGRKITTFEELPEELLREFYKHYESQKQD